MQTHPHVVPRNEKIVFIVQVFANLQMKVNSRVWYLNLMPAVSNCEVHYGHFEGPGVEKYSLRYERVYTNKNKAQ